MTAFIHTQLHHHLGRITLDRPKALNSLSLDMVRELTSTLRQWRDDARVTAVLIESSSPKAFCAGGDIRFFYEVGSATPVGGSALLEDFFTEEYALNHLIHFYPKPFIALMDGVVMGGGMGIAQSGPQSRLRVVTERTKMAMPEVNIGLFPDVGGSFFLSRAPGAIGTYLGLTGAVIGAADALYSGLADVFIPGSEIDSLRAALNSASDAKRAVRDLSARFSSQCDPSSGTLAEHRARIDRHFGAESLADIIASLSGDSHPFAQQAAAMMALRSPLMMAVTLAEIRRGAQMSLADCLRMERSLVRRVFEHGEVLEGVRAMVIDKDSQPAWRPAAVSEVTPGMVDHFFTPAWPSHAHPLRHLD